MGHQRQFESQQLESILIAPCQVNQHSAITSLVGKHLPRYLLYTKGKDWSTMGYRLPNMHYR